MPQQGSHAVQFRLRGQQIPSAERIQLSAQLLIKGRVSLGAGTQSQQPVRLI
jgi:hypothetical protein